MKGRKKVAWKGVKQAKVTLLPHTYDLHWATATRTFLKLYIIMVLSIPFLCSIVLLLSIIGELFCIGTKTSSINFHYFSLFLKKSAVFILLWPRNTQDRDEIGNIICTFVGKIFIKETSYHISQWRALQFFVTRLCQF